MDGGAAPEAMVAPAERRPASPCPAFAWSACYLPAGVLPPGSSSLRLRDSSSPFGRPGGCSTPVQKTYSRSLIQPGRLRSGQLHRNHTIQCSPSHSPPSFPVTRPGLPRLLQKAVTLTLSDTTHYRVASAAHGLGAPDRKAPAHDCASTPQTHQSNSPRASLVRRGALLDHDGPATVLRSRGGSALLVSGGNLPQ